MLIDLGLLCAGALLLFIGGEGVVRAGSAIGLRLGLAPVVVGLTIVAFGTSAPEMVVGLGASLTGHGEMAVANVLGSNLANVALVLGICAMLAPVAVESRLVSVDIPLGFVALASIWIVMSDGVMSRLEGAGFATVLIIWLWMSVLVARREPDVITREFEESLAEPMALAPSIALLLVGLGLLVFGGDLFVDGGVGLARELGVTEAVIGLTVIAVGTSLPELITSILAAWRGKADMAVGNVVGSNLFNVLGVLGFSAVAAPLPVGGVLPADLLITLFTAALLWPLARSSFSIARIEGVVLVAIYFGYIGWRLISL